MLLTQISLHSSIADKRCEEGWRFYGESCYYREGKKKALKSWEKAQKFCESKQANLVTVNDADEQKFLGQILGKKGSWCGLNKKDNKNDFEWVSGEESAYTNWAPNQPSSSGKKHCVHLRFAGHKNKWVMEKCAKKRRFTCEKGRLGMHS